jgi:hypothetical protein
VVPRLAEETAAAFGRMLQAPSFLERMHRLLANLMALNDALIRSPAARQPRPAGALPGAVDSALSTGSVFDPEVLRGWAAMGRFCRRMAGEDPGEARISSAELKVDGIETIRAARKTANELRSHLERVARVPAALNLRSWPPADGLKGLAAEADSQCGLADCFEHLIWYLSQHEETTGADVLNRAVQELDGQTSAAGFSLLATLFGEEQVPGGRPFDSWLLGRTRQALRQQFNLLLADTREILTRRIAITMAGHTATKQADKAGADRAQVIDQLMAILNRFPVDSWLYADVRDAVIEATRRCLDDNLVGRSGGTAATGPHEPVKFLPGARRAPEPAIYADIGQTALALHLAIPIVETLTRSEGRDAATESIRLLMQLANCAEVAAEACEVAINHCRQSHPSEQAEYSHILAAAFRGAYTVDLMRPAKS